MSRIGKNPVEIPKGVKAEVIGKLLKIEGPKGKLERTVRREIDVKLEDGRVVFTRSNDAKESRAYHGLERSLAANMVKGVTEGFVKELQLIGVGYRADTKGNTLSLGLGYSHPIDFELPKGVSGKVLKEGRDIFVQLEGIDKQLVGQVAAEIKSLRPPEPYKGKGVRYRGEFVKIKAGKAGKK